jgi:hypothetical protein
MAKGDKYIGLRQYLLNSKKDMVTLSFKDIEQIVGNILPKSAHIYSEVWWANDYSHSQAIAWIDAGYETDFVSDTYKEEKIVFIKR